MLRYDQQLSTYKNPVYNIIDINHYKKILYEYVSNSGIGSSIQAISMLLTIRFSKFSLSIGSFLSIATGRRGHYVHAAASSVMDHTAGGRQSLAGIWVTKSTNNAFTSIEALLVT
jgi:hypothetical protein